MDDRDHLEELLAGALAAYDDGGEPALQQFLQQHPAEKTKLQAGIERCRQMGMLGSDTPAKDFPDKLGEFKLLRRLGGGGMGVVYEAEQTSLGRRVALKVIRPELLFFEGARERFRREIEAVARLSHPAVVPVLASGEQDGVPYYVMELLAGRTVSEICTAFAGRDPAELQGSELRQQLDAASQEATDPFAGPWWQTCVRAIHTVALGARHAHLRGIVHRDIKPSNVMITPHGQAVLLDFGVASVGGGREFTRSGQTPGSPAFMSPEQLRGAAVDERTDVYSLGATLWQMLTLVAPFRGVEDLHRIRDGEVPSLRAKNRSVPQELVLVVRTAMDRDRERRYADMDAFAADLHAVLQRRPIGARRLGAGLRLLRWCQRHRVAATALVALLLGAAALPAVVAWRTSETNVMLAKAKQDAEGGLVLAAAAKARADDSLEQTLDALAKVLLRLGHEQLRHVPQAEAIGIEALQDAVTMYRRLLPGYPDHVRLRKNAARALGSLAAALERAGRTEEALAGYREAVDVFGGARMDLPDEWIDGRAHAEMNMASVLANLGRRELALAAIADAERDFGALRDKPAFRATTLRGLGELCTARSALLDERTDVAAIEGLLREALRLSREQLALDPDNAEAMAALVRRIDNLATLLAQNKRGTEAEPLLEEALAMARSIAPDARIWPPPGMAVSTVLETLGNLRVDQKDSRAPALLEECLQLREKAAADFPTNLELRSRLGAAAHHLGRCYFWQARDEQALEQLQRAASLQRDVLRENPDFRMARVHLIRSLSMVGTCQNKLGRREGLLATARELAAHDRDTGALRTAARLWLRALALARAEDPPVAASVCDEYVRASLDLLLAAEKLGWGPGSRLDEPLYEPLQALPEFAALRERLAARGK